MRRPLMGAAVAAALALPLGAGAADNAEMAEIRGMIERMKADYESRIQALERRLEQAERAAAAAPEDRPQAQTRAGRGYGAVTSGNAFNPQLSVILDGNYYHDGVDGRGAELAGDAFQPSHTHGHDHEGHAHGAMDNGFNFREAELAFSATVDPYFDAAAYLALDADGNIELEEAWLHTRALPHGLRVKAGKFPSGFGYINDQHPHQWDFADQNLAYLNLLGDHGLRDTGLQLTWLPELPLYTLLGAELFQGEQERFGAYVDDEAERAAAGLDARDDGPRLWTLFAKLAPDLGYDHALQLGLSYAHNRRHQELHEHDGFENGLQGDADLWGLDLVYKYDGSGADGLGDFKLQSEYLRSVKDLTVTGGDPDAVGSAREFTTDGWYLQGLYGFAPRWRAGLRYDVLGPTNRVRGGTSKDFGSSDRWSLAVAWTPTEFSLLRLQYARNDILTETGLRERFDVWWLQFLMSLGSHGAHRF